MYRVGISNKMLLITAVKIRFLYNQTYVLYDFLWTFVTKRLEGLKEAALS